MIVQQLLLVQRNPKTENQSQSLHAAGCSNLLQSHCPLNHLAVATVSWQRALLPSSMNVLIFPS
ncbi:hypothetical protein DAI22_12g060000 [Oryza sativa Japonica Group]|nr:hypothetical protein DAI22_12g060000 [Oryza sativa Japonica Group]